jgi:hypothetical protein
LRVEVPVTGRLVAVFRVARLDGMAAFAIGFFLNVY